MLPLSCAVTQPQALPTTSQMTRIQYQCDSWDVLRSASESISIIVDELYYVHTVGIKLGDDSDLPLSA